MNDTSILNNLKSADSIFYWIALSSFKLAIILIACLSKEMNSGIYPMEPYENNNVCVIISKSFELLITPTTTNIIIFRSCMIAFQHI